MGPGLGMGLGLGIASRGCMFPSLVGGTIAEDDVSDTTATISQTVAPGGGVGAIARQWQLDGVNVSGETGTTLTLEDLDPATAYEVRLKYTDGEGQVAYANRLTVTTEAAWTPLASAPSIFAWMKSPYCLKTDTGVCVPGDRIASALPQFGATVTALQAAGGSQPFFRSDGADNFSVSQLNLSGLGTLSNNFTIYLTGYRVAGTTLAILGAVTDGALIGWLEANFLAIDDTAEAYFSGAEFDAVAGDFLLIIRMNAGEISVDATGVSHGSGNLVGNPNAMTFNQLGNAAQYQGGGSGSGDAINRIRIVEVITRYIAYDSAEDLNQRAWILANDGAAL